MRSFIPIIVIIVLLGVGALALLANNRNQQNNNAAQTGSFTTQVITPTVSPTIVDDVTPSASPSASSSAATDSAAAAEKTITVSSTAATPATLTIKAGTKVVWQNSSSATVEIASAPHPRHTDYPPLNLGDVPVGGTTSLVFDEPGKYTWHNHYKPNVKGVITVTK